MFSWVRVLNGAGASWVVWKQLQAHACSRCSALCVHCVRCAFIVRRPKKHGPLTPLTNSKFEFVPAKTASWSCNSDSLANFVMPMDFYFFACTPEATYEFIPIISEAMEVSHSTGRREPFTTCRPKAFTPHCTWTRPVGREPLTTC